MKNSDLTAELIPVSHHVADVAALGLVALDKLQNRVPVSATTQQNLTLLQHLEQPEAALIDRIVTGVKLLMQAIPHTNNE